MNIVFRILSIIKRFAPETSRIAPLPLPLQLLLFLRLFFPLFLPLGVWSRVMGFRKGTLPGASRPT